MKGRGGSPRRTRYNGTDIVLVEPPPRYDFEGNVSVVLSTRILIDGSWVDMEEGFPMLIERGGKDIFVFRFPLFNEAAVYDPHVDLSGAVEEVILEESQGLAGDDDDDSAGDDDDDNGTSSSRALTPLHFLQAMSLFFAISWAL